MTEWEEWICSNPTEKVTFFIADIKNIGLKNVFYKPEVWKAAPVASQQIKGRQA